MKVGHQRQAAAGAHRGSMDELTGWTLAADRIVTFWTTWTVEADKALAF